MSLKLRAACRDRQRNRAHRKRRHGRVAAAGQGQRLVQRLVQRQWVVRNARRTGHIGASKPRTSAFFVPATTRV